MPRQLIDPTLSLSLRYSALQKPSCCVPPILPLKIMAAAQLYGRKRVASFRNWRVRRHYRIDCNFCCRVIKMDFVLHK